MRVPNGLWRWVVAGIAALAVALAAAGAATATERVERRVAIMGA